MGVLTSYRQAPLTYHKNYNAQHILLKELTIIFKEMFSETSDRTIQKIWLQLSKDFFD